MNYLNLPPLELLHSCFVLTDDGALVWRIRPESHFSSSRIARWWNKKYAGKVAGRMDNSGYLGLGLNGARYLVHRLVFFMSSGIDPGDREVDHRDNNTANNAPTNLRLAMRAQNQHNASLRSDNKSGVKGVSWYPKNRCWVAQIRKDGKRQSAYFASVEAAAHWVRTMRNNLHGDFARHGGEF